jgi:hypothetical protein
LALLVDRETQELPHAAWPVAQQRLLLAQLPLVHWLLLWQEPPLATWATQAPPVQYLPEAHVTTLLAVQAPAPLHTEAVFMARSLLHDAPLQAISLPG